MVAVNGRATAAPPVGDAGEQEALVRLNKALAASIEGDLCLVTATGESLVLPDPVRRVLAAATEMLTHGEALKLVPVHAELSTSQAAALLSISRPHLIKLLDEGVIPYRRVGTHRRIGLRDLSTYLSQRSAHSRDLLAQMARIAEESAGGYD